MLKQNYEKLGKPSIPRIFPFKDGISCTINLFKKVVRVRHSFHIIWDTVKVFVMFVGCTALFYYAFIWINQEYESYHKYDAPKGHAVKVSQTTGSTETFDWLNRLELFYQVGE